MGGGKLLIINKERDTTKHHICRGLTTNMHLIDCLGAPWCTYFYNIFIMGGFIAYINDIYL